MPGLDKFLSDLGECLSGTKTFRLVIEDALGLSTIQPLPHRTSQLKTETYRRKASEDIYHGLERESVLATDQIKDNRETLARLVRDAQKIVILSGAGISTESGIPAFRSPDGLDNIWDKYDMTKATLAAIEAEEPARAEYWAMHSELYELVFEKGVLANPSHMLAVELEKRNKLHMVVTQNIDGLYQASGLPVEKLLELHGTITKCLCSKCRQPHSRSEAHEVWKCGIPVPRCKHCAAPLRFGTIAFGEALNSSVLEAARKAMRECDLLLVMGTSLVVQPANKLPEICLDAGIPVVLLNLGPTPLDNVVDLHISGKCGVVSQYVLDHLTPTTACQEELFAIAPLVWSGIVEGINPCELKLAAFSYQLRKQKA